MIRLIALKELRSLFHAPSTWYALAALQLILGWIFLWLLDTFLKIQPQLTLIANAPGATQAIVPVFFREFLSPLIMVVTPIFTMRLLTEERRNQTMPLLLSAPVSGARIVLGKFAGLMTLLWLIILCNAAMAFTLKIGTALDVGLVLSNTAGLMLLAAGNAALGLYISSLTAQPLIAAIGALAALLGPMWIERSALDTYRLWHDLAPTGHFHSFNAGLLDSADVVYYLLFCALFLSLAIRRLDNARVYG